MDPTLLEYMVEYVKLARSKGYDFVEIRNILLKQGQKTYDVDEAIDVVKQQTQPITNNDSSFGKEMFSNDNAFGGVSDNDQSQKEVVNNDVSPSEPLLEPLNSEVQHSSLGNIKKRNPVKVFLLSCFTLGIYPIYWLVKTSNEINEHVSKKLNPKFLWWLLILAPIIFPVYVWKYSKALKEFTDYDQVVSFVLLWLFFPIGAFIVQTQINKKIN